MEYLSIQRDCNDCLKADVIKVVAGHRALCDDEPLLTFITDCLLLTVNIKPFACSETESLRLCQIRVGRRKHLVKSNLMMLFHRHRCVVSGLFCVWRMQKREVGDVILSLVKIYLIITNMHCVITVADSVNKFIHILSNCNELSQ